MGTIEAYGSNIINSKGEGYTQITWDDWNELTPEQQKAIPKAIITDIPGVNGTVNAELLKTLWVNPDPTVAFAAQTITLVSDDYDFLLVSSKCHFGASIIVSFIAPKGHDILTYYVSTSSGTSLNDFERLLTRNSDTSFSVAGCTYQPSGSAKSTNNDYMVPLAIYGIKKNIEFDLTAVVANVSTDASKCMLSNGTSVENALTVEDLTSQITINTAVVANTPAVTVLKCGHIVQVYVGGVIFKANGDNQTILSGLPVAKSQMGGTIGGANASSTASLATSGNACWIGQNSGVLRGHITAYTTQHWMYLTYLA